MALIPYIHELTVTEVNRVLRKLASSKLGPAADVTFKSLTLTGLTATRVLFAGAGGVVSDDAGFTYASATDILTAGTYNATDEDNILQVDGTTIFKADLDRVEPNFFVGSSVGVGAGATASANVGIGYNIMTNLTLGGANVGIGYQALRDVTEGTSNFGLGSQALLSLIGADDCVAIGKNAGQSVTSGNSNILIGANAGLSITTRGGNTYIGSGAGRLNIGEGNVGIGGDVLRGTGSRAIWNVGIGGVSLYSITIGEYNVGIGAWTGFSLSSGDRNIFLGPYSGYNQTTNSDLLIIDNRNRGSIAAELTDCLICGVFNATPASQSLRFNVGTTTWHNATHTDDDGGRKSQLNFKGQQSGGEETTLARIEVGHDGSSDDEKGYWDLFINDGNDGDSPTKKLRVDSDGATLTDLLTINQSADGTPSVFEGLKINGFDDKSGEYFVAQINSAGSSKLIASNKFLINSLNGFLINAGNGSVIAQTDFYVQTDGAVELFGVTASANIRCWPESVEGETKEFEIYGYRTSDSLRSLQIGVGTDAADTVSFDGVSNYWFDGTVRTGAFATNYIDFAPTGMTMAGTARINWTKITANAVSIENGHGVITGAVATLQTAHDGSFLEVAEEAETPGIEFLVDFVSVTAFNWVNILCCYDANTATHAIAIQLYNYTQTRWDTFDSIQKEICNITTGDGYILSNHDFIVPDDTEYIGTDGDAGKVRVRFYHTMGGAAAHDLRLDVVALYQ